MRSSVAIASAESDRSTAARFSRRCATDDVPGISNRFGDRRNAVDAAVAGTGVIHLFEDWLRPHLERGALEPLLEAWWRPFPGPFLYDPSRRYLPAPLRAFVDFIGDTQA